MEYITETLKGLARGINFVDIATFVQGNSVKRFLQKFGISKGTTAVADGEAKAAEGGKGNTDEHNALLALANAGLTQPQVANITAVFKELRLQGKPHGAEKLMHIIGHESHLQGTPMTRKPATQAGKKDGEQPKEEAPATIEIVNVKERINPSGKSILVFLASLPTQDAVDLLVQMSITDTFKDKAAAASKSAGDKIIATWRKLVQNWGDNDTLMHILAAQYILRGCKLDGRPAFEYLMESKVVKGWERRIANAPDTDQRRKAQEDFQKWLQPRALCIHDENKCSEAVSKRFRVNSRLLILIICVVITVASLIKSGVDAKKFNLTEALPSLTQPK